MSDEFLDNQIVTAADMNNIAIDLGYSDYSHFPETPPQSAVSALNQITSDLVSKGVLILGNKCNVTASGGTAYVDTGVIVFDSGAKKRIEAVQSLSLTAGSINYIYAINDTVNNTIELVCSTEEPSTGDFVMLAEVSENGKVTNKCNYSSAKVNVPTKNSYQKLSYSFYVKTTDYDISDWMLYGSISTEIDNYNFIILKNKNDYEYKIAKFENGETITKIGILELKFVRDGFNIDVYIKYTYTNSSYSLSLNIYLM